MRDAVGARAHDARDVTFAFGRGGPVLDGVSLEYRAGERVAIVGRSGEGKSTIADLLVRQLDPQGGRVLLDGIDLRAARAGATSAVTCSSVDQDPFVFNATIAENIRYARPDAPDADVRAAADAAGLARVARASAAGPRHERR